MTRTFRLMALSCTLLASAWTLADANKLRMPSDLASKIRWLRNKPCAYAEDPAMAVHDELSRTIVGQDSALVNITDAVSAWHSDYLNGLARPLVMVFTGGTGVGKTETAKATSRALLTGRRSIAGAPGMTEPDGESHVYGVEFSGQGEPEDAVNITALQDKLKDNVAQLLYECHGHGVLILDETQKIPKAVLAPLRGILGGQHATMHHPSVGPLSAARMVIIIISDVGMPEVSDFVTAVYSNPANSKPINGKAPVAAPPKRLDVLHSTLTARMRAVVDAEFSKGAFELGGLADSIISFLPFNQSGVRAIVHRWLADYRDSVTVRRHAHSLTWSQAFVDMLATPRYAKYSYVEPGKPNIRSACFNESLVQVAARKAAFNSRASSGQQAAQATATATAAPEAETASASVTADGTSVPVGGDLPASVSSSPEPLPSVCGEQCDLPRVCYLPHGARGLKNHAEEAWQKLKLTLERELRRAPRLEEAVSKVLGQGRPPPGHGRPQHGGPGAGAGASQGAGKGHWAKAKAHTLGADSIWDRVGRAAGSLVSTLTHAAADPAVEAAHARRQARQAMEAVQAALAVDGQVGLVEGQTVPADTEPLARLHLDVSCAAHVSDGACGLRGVTFTFTRCVGHAVPQPRTASKDGGQAGRDSAKHGTPGENPVPTVSPSPDLDEAGNDDHSGEGRPHEHASPAMGTWRESCAVLYEGDIL